MTNKSNLRFFLALGNQKVVVFEKEKNIHIYADKKTDRPNVSINRLSALIRNK